MPEEAKKKRCNSYLPRVKLLAPGVFSHEPWAYTVDQRGSSCCSKQMLADVGEVGGKDVEGEEGFEAIQGFQYLQVNTWQILTYIIKDACE